MNWLKRILSQKYPGGHYQGQGYAGPVHTLNIPEKAQYWGLEPKTDWQTHSDLYQNMNLSRIPPQQVDFAINHVAETFYPQCERIIRETSSSFCTNQEYHVWMYPEDDEASPLYDNIEQITKNLAHRAEVTDPDFIRQLANFIQDETLSKIETLFKQKHKDETFFVRVYGSSRAFGGTEEGGWWYNSNALVHEEQIKGLQNACHRRAQFEKEYKDKGEDSFYEDLMNLHGGVHDLYDETNQTATGMGDLDYGTRDVEGMDYPRGWTTSSFEKYFVRVELSEHPLAETTSIPRYE